MAASDRISIAGEPYEIADQSTIKTGRRTYIETQRPSQPFETTPQVYSWAPWGPLGNSRQRLGGPLSTDYADNLDTRNDSLLTSTGKVITVDTLISASAVNWLVPIADVTKANWSEGAGDGDGDAFDELDEGIESGTPDDATTYWTTTTSAAEIRCNVTSVANPDGKATVNVNVRFRHTAGITAIKVTLYQGATLINQWTLDPSVFGAAGTWYTFAGAAGTAISSAITDWTDLRAGFQFTAGSGTLDCSTLEVGQRLKQPVIVINDDRGFVWVSVENHSVMMDPNPGGDITRLTTLNHGSEVTDEVNWQGAAFIALGSADVVQKRTAVTGGVGTYADVTGVNAKKLARGSDRIWIADAVSDNNKLKFAVDDLTSANLSNAIQVVDPGVDVTGLSAVGPYIVAGNERGANSFTQSGKPAKLLRSLEKFQDVANGRSSDSLWGWNYQATKLGLFAISVDPLIANPVGPGEGLRGQGFEGPVDGYPTAVAAFKDSLWVAYLNPDGDSYLFRGMFGVDTAVSGRPEWFPFRKLSSKECRAIGSTAARDKATLIWGEDDDIAYTDLALRGRDISDSDYTFSTDGGQWFGTTLMMPIGVRGNVRWAKLFTENCVASTDTWQVAVDVDDADSYIDVGSAITANGAQTVRPTEVDGEGNTVPLTSVSFTSLKPRLTQVASSETAPPQIRGELAIGVDARPDMVREVDVLLDLEKQSQLTDLQALIGDTQQPPVKMRLPTDQGVNADKYGHVVSADWYDRSDPTDNVALVKLREWEIS